MESKILVDRKSKLEFQSLYATILSLIFILIKQYKQLQLIPIKNFYDIYLKYFFQYQ